MVRRAFFGERQVAKIDRRTPMKQCHAAAAPIIRPTDPPSGNPIDRSTIDHRPCQGIAQHWMQSVPGERLGQQEQRYILYRFRRDHLASLKRR